MHQRPTLEGGGSKEQGLPKPAAVFHTRAVLSAKGQWWFCTTTGLGHPADTKWQTWLEPMKACMHCNCMRRRIYVYIYIYIYIGPPQAFQHRLHGYYICNITRLMQMHICARVRVHMPLRMHAHAHMHGLHVPAPAIILSYYCSTILLYYYIVILLYYQINIL